jgi:hypothetical protein
VDERDLMVRHPQRSLMFRQQEVICTAMPLIAGPGGIELDGHARWDVPISVKRSSSSVLARARSDSKVHSPA